MQLYFNYLYAKSGGSLVTLGKKKCFSFWGDWLPPWGAQLNWHTVVYTDSCCWLLSIIKERITALYPYCIQFPAQRLVQRRSSVNNSENEGNKAIPFWPHFLSSFQHLHQERKTKNSLRKIRVLKGFLIELGLLSKGHSFFPSFLKLYSNSSASGFNQ